MVIHHSPQQLLLAAMQAGRCQWECIAITPDHDYPQ